MKLKFIYSCLVMAGFTASAFAQDTPDPTMTAKIREEGLNHSHVMDIAFHITDAAGPRLAGSPGLKRAQDWAVSQLKTWGLVNAAREPWGKFGKGWEVQKNYAAITVPYYHAIIAIPKAWTPGTGGPVNGDVVLIKADSLPDMAKYKGTLQGKVVVFDTKPNVERTYKPDAVRYTDSALNAMANATAKENQRPAFNRNSPAFAARRKALALRAAINEFLYNEHVAL